MGRSDKKEKQIIENIRIIDIAADGMCVGKHNDKVVFVESVVPGDVVDVRVMKDKKSFATGSPVKFHQYSDKRVEAICEHFGVCGGCKWQNMNYDTQLTFKEKQVKDNLERIGKVQVKEYLPILGSKETILYRNKLEFTFADRRWLTKDELDSGVLRGNALGFHIPGRFDSVIEINECYLQGGPSNAIRKEVAGFARANGISFYNFKEKKGDLRNLIVRTASTGEVMVIVQFFENNQDRITKVLQHLKDTFKEITSLYYVVNNKGNETFHDLNLVLFEGKPYITESMEGLKFQIGPKSFYQTNSLQAYELYKIAREFAGLTGSEVVYDLYTGTGTIANFVASSARKVIGIEYVPMAIEDAKVNSQINNIANTLFYAGDMKDVLSNEFVDKHGKPDVVITDPPRAGMHEDVVLMLKRIAAPKIVYVSCNAATQARDLEMLSDMYEVVKSRAVDMFPHTYHVENVCLLQLR